MIGSRCSARNSWRPLRLKSMKRSFCHAAYPSERNRRTWFFMLEPIRFARYDSILLELGFKKKVVPGKYIVYWHQPSDTVMPVRLMKPDELVPDYQMAATRSQLDGRGIIEAADFEEMLKAITA